MGLSTEQTVAVIESVADVVEASRPVQEQGWFIPLIITVIGGIITTVFGVWYSRRKKNEST